MVCGERRVGKAGVQVGDRGKGADTRKLGPLSPPKSERAEITFDQDTWDKDFLRRCLMAHAERVGTSLRKQGFAGRTITLKLKYADFTQITRSRTLPANTDATQTIFEVGCQLLDAVSLSQKVRLIGLGVSGFQQHSQQNLLPGMDFKRPDVVPEEEEKRRKLDGALDNLRQRFGSQAVVRGRLFSKE